MSSTRFLTALTAGLVTIVVASCGNDTTDVTPAVDRSVTIEMRDTAFKPSKLTAERGETIRFRFVNHGRLKHDAFIGDKHAQRSHEKEMRDGMTEHGMHDAGMDAITVAPGRTGRITHRFDKRGTFMIGCHQPGHYAAGMVAKITVR
jgi:uncharacterized cupredoxin-like copper-binding protein